MRRWELGTFVIAALLGGSAPPAAAQDAPDEPPPLVRVPPLVRSDAYHPGDVNGIPTPNGENDEGPDLCDAIEWVMAHGSDEPVRLETNADADGRWMGEDALWRDLSGTVAFIGLTARYGNTLGVYTDPGSGADRTPLLGPRSGFGFSAEGTREDPFPAASLQVGPGRPFGWYLAWEDMPWTGSALGDDDYDDMIYVVGRVMQVAQAR